jgi:hypothetical protein
VPIVVHPDDIERRARDLTVASTIKLVNTTNVYEWDAAGSGMTIRIG